MHEHMILCAALLAGFYMAWTIGANDVANAFGTSVGSGALTFRRALVLAAIFEFAGAFLCGSHVSDTIKGNIVMPDLFIGRPEVFAHGMLAALIASSVWLHVATYLGQPVSTTHAIIGAVIGFGLVDAGIDAIQWHKMGRIAASWFVSPVVGALFAFCIYFALRRHVLHAVNPVQRSMRAVPIGLAATVFIVVFSSAHSFLPRFLEGPSASPHFLAMASTSAGLVSAAIAGAVSYGLLRRVRLPTALSPEQGSDLIERWFGKLQVLTACYMAFAHGANDVANAIGPIAGVLQALKGCLTAKTQIPMWVLAFGGIGIVAGLAMYGQKVIEAVGRKITEVTPTRGFSAEFGTATTVLVCSLLGLPISTTFVLVGAVMGVGFARGFGAIDLGVVKRIFLSWVVTIPICSTGTALIYLGLRALV